MTQRPALNLGETLLLEGRPDTDLRSWGDAVGLGILGLMMILAAARLSFALGRDFPSQSVVAVPAAVGIMVVLIVGFPVLQSFRYRQISYALTDLRAFLMGTRPLVEIEGDRTAFPIPSADHRTLSADAICFAKCPTRIQRGGFLHRTAFDVGSNGSATWRPRKSLRCFVPMPAHPMRLRHDYTF